MAKILSLVLIITLLASLYVYQQVKILQLAYHEQERLAVLKSTIEEFGGEIHEKLYAGFIEKKKVLMTHKPDKIEPEINGGKYDLIIYGHTHKPDIRMVENTLVVNPGEATDWITGESHLVILDFYDMSYEHIAL